MLLLFCLLIRLKFYELFHENPPLNVLCKSLTLCTCKNLMCIARSANIFVHKDRIEANFVVKLFPKIYFILLLQALYCGSGV